MSVVRFSPFQTLETLREQLAKNIEEVEECCNTSSNLYLPLELREDDSNFYLRSIVPGVEPDSINIEVENGLIAINCELQRPELKENERIYFSDFCYGSFKRSVKLGNLIDPDNISADYKNGILSLTIPKSAKAMKKTIKISNIVE